jgi:hypothetical protein
MPVKGNHEMTCLLSGRHNRFLFQSPQPGNSPEFFHLHAHPRNHLEVVLEAISQCTFPNTTLPASKLPKLS